MIEAYTDYPIIAYGDVPGEKAPIRRATILTYDGNKYCDVLVYQVDENGNSQSVCDNFKRWYLYKNKSRFDGGVQFNDDELLQIVS